MFEGTARAWYCGRCVGKLGKFAGINSSVAHDFVYAFVSMFESARNKKFAHLDALAAVCLYVLRDRVRMCDKGDGFDAAQRVNVAFTFAVNYLKQCPNGLLNQEFVEILNQINKEVDEDANVQQIERTLARKSGVDTGASFPEQCISIVQSLTHSAFSDLTQDEIENFVWIHIRLLESARTDGFSPSAAVAFVTAGVLVNRQAYLKPPMTAHLRLAFTLGRAILQIYPEDQSVPVLRECFNEIAMESNAGIA